MADVDPAKPPAEAPKPGKEALPNTAFNTYYLIHYDCPVGPVQSVVAEWRVVHRNSILTGSGAEQYKYEGNNVVRPRAPDFLANELKTCDLGATTETELQLYNNFTVEDCPANNLSKLVAVYSKTFPTTAIKCLPNSDDLLTTTINMAPIFTNIMMQDGLSYRGPWKSDIRELALKIQNESGMVPFPSKLVPRTQDELIDDNGYDFSGSASAPGKKILLVAQGLQIIAKSETHVLDVLRLLQSPDDNAPHQHAQEHISIDMSLLKQVHTKSGLMLLDLSSSPAKVQVLECLHRDGWVVLKNAASTKSQQQAPSNEVVLALLSAARRGSSDFESSYPEVSWPSNLQKGPNPIQRPQNWRGMVQERATDIVAISCHHLWGDETDIWDWEYDTGLRGDETGQMASVAATGGDLLICSGWLPRRLPKPRGQTDLVTVKHRWKHFGWTTPSREP
ncbi:uncharacterized protein BDCG_08440 [Blastomyces dermatitidis ER-3]|uniref:Uncharacterized protein n=1 Tax=Ajellomyces dermatitidis (strain ER-3 / ATCC MYA-2586) TaxID=559297 RepID=A0ABP2ENY1_AJEDR|nr:uncharacterized protein BDCG_08440 [Blastomyces dermatitidis ER-3]EEQ85171.2 hypothetical protein BDCG_08440 [Blastomyces dermatitidis ER-3]